MQAMPFGLFYDRPLFALFAAAAASCGLSILVGTELTARRRIRSGIEFSGRHFSAFELYARAHASHLCAGIRLIIAHLYRGWARPLQL
jgi:hypothetical protein